MLRDMEEAKSKQMQYEQISSQLKDLEEQIASFNSKRNKWNRLKKINGKVAIGA